MLYTMQHIMHVDIQLSNLWTRVVIDYFPRYSWNSNCYAYIFGGAQSNSSHNNVKNQVRRQNPVIPNFICDVKQAGRRIGSRALAILFLNAFGPTKARLHKNCDATTCHVNFF